MSDPPDAVLFDLYGTLIHGGAEDPSFAQALAELGFDPASPEYIWLLAGLPIASLAVAIGADIVALRDAALVHRTERASDLVALARSLGLTKVEAAPEECVRKTELVVEQMLMRERLVDGAAELLDALRRAGTKLALVSNIHELSVPVIERLGLGEYFPVQVLSCRVGAVKPSEAMYREALDALGVPARRAIAVGDSWASDVVGALRAGMRAIWVDRGQDGLAEQIMERRWAELADPGAPPGSFRVRPAMRRSLGKCIPGSIEELEAALSGGGDRAPDFLTMCRRVRSLRELSLPLR